MNISKLLASRKTLIERTRLANLAFAYATLKRFAGIARRARLTGLVRVKLPDHRAECLCAEIVALSGNQSVIEEHFSDDDIVAIADAIAFTANADDTEIVLRIDDIPTAYLVPLMSALKRAGVSWDRESLARLNDLDETAATRG